MTTEEWRPSAFAAWAAGSIAAFAVEKLAPEYCTAISAAVVAGVVYFALMRILAVIAKQPVKYFSAAPTVSSHL